MTRCKSLLAALLVTAIVAVVPVAAQNVHFVGAGSSAQFLMTAIAANQAALDANSALYSNANTVKHWTKKSVGSLTDNRDTLNRITAEPGQVFLVWIEDGSGVVKDVWTMVQVDSTVGVRCILAQEKISGLQVPGCQVQIGGGVQVSDNLVSPNSLWPDNTGDVTVTLNALNAINTSVSGGVHVNVGLTDIRPEDALAATTRSLTALNTTTYKGLGYVGPTANIGAPINTDQSTNTNATPIKFALQGKADPFTHFTVGTYTTIPIGAAPIIFMANNNTGTAAITNLVSGITPGVHAASQTYPASQFFGGVNTCDTHDAAFGGNGDGLGTPLAVFLREPLSGTMNTTEFTTFRTFGNTNSTQETGIINPTRAPYNPLHLACPNGASSTVGYRSRGIGTGEVRDAVKNTANSISYMFFAWANSNKYTALSKYNYLTLDGVDPLFDTPTSYSVCTGGTNNGVICADNTYCTGGGTCTAGGSSNQTMPECTSATCSTALWPSGNSYPHLRDGTYKAWSLYRWIVYTGSSDAYGPEAVAQDAQNRVDSDVADFVPFVACPLGDPTCASSSPTDGLSVYRSHFTQSGITCAALGPCNGAATAGNGFNGGNSLGGFTEGGGDEGGLIEGPFGITTPAAHGYVTWAATITTGKGYKVTWKQGDHFAASWGKGPWTITINGIGHTVASCSTCTPTTTTLYVNDGNLGTLPLVQLSYSAPFSTGHIAAVAPGIVAKKQ
jgi:hypothetical protein